MAMHEGERPHGYHFSPRGAAEPQPAADQSLDPSTVRLQALPETPAPQMPEPAPEGRFLEEQEVAPDDSSPKMKIALFALGAVVLLGALWMIVGFVIDMRRAATTSSEPGLLDLALYGQTRNRLAMLGMASQTYFDRHGQLPAHVNELKGDGVDPRLLNDRWKNPIVILDTRLVSGGSDGTVGNEDDTWFDMDSMEPGGHFPDQEKIIEKASAMLPPEAQQSLRDAQANAEESERRMMRIQAEYNASQEGGASQWTPPEQTTTDPDAPEIVNPYEYLYEDTGEEGSGPFYEDEVE